MRVLIVDDASEIRGRLKLLLKGAGVIDVVEAKNGRSALLQITKGRFDIAFLDIELPDVNGLQLLGEMLRQDPKVKVIMCSGHSSMKNIRAALQAGASGFLVKPFSTQKLMALLASVREPAEVIR